MAGPESGKRMIRSFPEELDALWKMYQENCTHARHHENQRSTVAASTVAIAGFLVGAATFDGELISADRPLLLTAFVLGVFGALFSAKQTERAALHMRRARFYRNAIDRHLPGQPLYAEKDAADKENAAKYPVFTEFRIRHFWQGLYAFIAAGSLILSMLAVVPPQAGMQPDEQAVEATLAAEKGRAIATTTEDGAEQGSGDDVNVIANEASWSLPLGLLALVAVASFLWLLWRGRSGRGNDDAAPALRIVQSGTVGVSSALTAAAAAWVAIGDIGDAWKLMLPLLVAPIATILTVRRLKRPRAKPWVFATSLVISSGIGIAHLIDRQVRDTPSLWIQSFLNNAAELLAGLSFADYGTLAVALIAYVPAVAGTFKTTPPTAGRAGSE